MQAAARKTWRSGRSDVGSSYPAAGMETPDARKTWGGRRADVDSCRRAKPMEAAAPSKPGEVGAPMWGTPMPSPWKFPAPPKP
jgi:hypothetical protein